jgi:hypothetical protein
MARTERKKCWWMVWKRKQMLYVGSYAGSETEENSFIDEAVDVVTNMRPRTHIRRV